jgi:plastocyanin
MTGFLSRRIWRLAGAALIVTALLPIVAVSRGSGTPPPREIRIVVNDMTFYIEGQNEPNPMLRLRAGEQIRLVLHNEDPGMSHDFAVTSWQVQTPLLSERGAEAVVTFRVPERPGTYTYNCTPHADIMRGNIQVQ